MKIWIVNQYAISPAEAGGSRHFSFARELIGRGHQVVLVSGSLNYSTHEETRLAPGERWRTEEVEGVRFVWLRVSAYAGNSIGRVWSMIAFGQSVVAGAAHWGLSRPDVVIGSSPHLFAAWAAERLARRWGVPFVLEVRDLWPQSLVDVAGVRAGHPLVRALERLERHLYHRAAWVLSLLPGAAAHLEARGVPPDRIIWLPNGVDLTLVPLPAPPPEQGPFTVLYAGAHGVANGLDSILDAAALVQQTLGPDRVRFVFVGAGTEKERLERRALEEGIVTASFHAAVPKGQVYQSLALAHAFIVTLRDIELYRFGISLNKLYDYLAMARPTVFGARALNNPIDEAGAGLSVAPEDAEAMAKAIVDLVALEPKERWELGLRGRRFVEEHHDIKRLAERLEQVLQRVVTP